MHVLCTICPAVQHGLQMLCMHAHVRVVDKVAAHVLLFMWDCHLIVQSQSASGSNLIMFVQSLHGTFHCQQHSWH